LRQQLNFYFLLFTFYFLLLLHNFFRKNSEFSKELTAPYLIKHLWVRMYWKTPPILTQFAKLQKPAQSKGVEHTFFVRVFAFEGL